MLLRVMWSVALVVVLFEVGGDLRGCGEGWVVYTYLVCSLSTFAFSVVVESGITWVSTRGSIADTRLRESLSGYLNLHMMLGAVQLVMAVLGIVLMTRFESSCRGVLTDEAVNILLLVVTTSQIVDVLVTCCCCVLMSGNPEEVHGGGNEGYYERFPSTEIEGQWKTRCHWLYRVVLFFTCGLFGGRGIRQTDFDQTFDRLARIMARIFHTEEYLDVVPSDIAAGIVLLYHKQRHQRQTGASRLAGSPSSNSSPSLSRSGRAAAAAAAAAGRGIGWGGKRKDSGRGSSSRSSSPSSKREDERGERLSLTNGIVGGGGVDGDLPAGLRARSVGHEDFFKVRGRQVLDVANPEDERVLAEISHFSRYALAIYTWYLYMFDHPCCGACDLLCYSCTGRSRAFHRTRSKRDWGSPADGDNDDAAATPNTDHTPSGRESINGGGGCGGARQRKDVARANGRSGGDSGGGEGVGRGADGTGPDGGDNIRVPMRGDNWLGTHEAALLRVAGLHRGCEVVDAQFVSGITETPYCVLVDHNWKCVVVSIRGTMSLDDCLCDLQADPECMDESGKRWGFEGNGMYAHQGVLRRAEWVRQDLEIQGHLRALLGPAGATTAAETSGAEGMGLNRRGAPRYPGYSLRLTGHSLGGSTGALLTYMLRRDYPSARCVAISPLGGLLNSPYAEDCGEFVLSSALGEDVVPRLSVLAMERMRDEILELISRTKANKLTVMRSMVRAVSLPGNLGASRSSSGGVGDDSSYGDDLGGLLYSQAQDIPETRFSVQLRRYRALVDQKRALLPFPELLPAGRFVHYVKTHTNRTCCTKHWLYTPVWAKPADFSDIVVSKRMFLDHLPTKSCPRFMETFEMLRKEGREAAEAAAAAAEVMPGAERRSWGGSDVV
eukprot:g14194.t1